MNFVIGIDGGGTRSRAVALALDGRLLASADGGALNPYTSGQQPFADHLNALTGRLLEKLSGGRCRRTTVGTAALFGVSSPEEQARLMEGVDASWLGEIEMVGDAVVAAYGATEGKAGTLVIAGTGSIAVGIDQRGGLRFSGGLGPRISGDPGSAYWMACQAIATAQEQACRTGVLSPLGCLISEGLGCSRFSEVIERVYDPVEGQRRTAGLAVVLAKSRDSEILKCWLPIEESAGAALATLVAPLRDDLKSGADPLYISGSVLCENDRVRDSFLASLRHAHGKAVTLQRPRVGAARGAGLFSLSRLNLGGEWARGQEDDHG